MKILNLSRSVALAVFAIIITACAASKPIGQWRDPGFTGKVDNILIIGVSSRSTRRRVFEDRFVDVLAENEVKAIPSYTLITSTLKLSRETVVKAIEGKDLDAVLVTRIAGIKQQDTYQRPKEKSEDMTLFTYYDNALEQTSDGYYAQFNVFTLETNLYDAASTELIWSMQSEIVEGSRPRVVIEDQIKLTIDTMRSQGLIGG